MHMDYSPIMVENALIIERRNALGFLLGYSRIVVDTGCERSWNVPMLVECKWFASGLCIVCSMCFVLFCAGQIDDLDTTRCRLLQWKCK